MPEFGFVGQAYEAASITQDDQACINWYPEVDILKVAKEGESERGVTALYPTPGLETLVTLTGGEVRGMHVVPGGQTIYAVCGQNLYSIDSSFTATLISSAIAGTGPVWIADNGSSIYITVGTTRYAYTWGTSTFQTLTDGAFTGGSSCDEVDNYIVYSRPNSNQWGCTDVGLVTSGALNVGSKIGASDYIVAIVADHRNVLIIGERTSEKWINTGTFPFPFQIIPGSSMQHGCIAPASIARLGEGVAFLAQDDRGVATVVQWGATLQSPQRLSTYAIENAIQQYSTTSDAIAYSYAQAGHEFYVLSFPTADVTWVYDISTQMWHRRAWRDTNNIYHRHRTQCAVSFNGDVIAGDWQNGKIYRLSQTTYTDAGDILPCVRRCKHITKDLDRVFYESLQIQFQPGVGLQSGQGSDPECLLRWSNDGGFTWSNDHVLKLGQVGQYKRRAIKRRLGYARDRVFEIEVTDPVYRVVVSSELKVSGGAS